MNLSEFVRLSEIVGHEKESRTGPDRTVGHVRQKSDSDTSSMKSTERIQLHQTHIELLPRLLSLPVAGDVEVEGSGTLEVEVEVDKAAAAAVALTSEVELVLEVEVGGAVVGAWGPYTMTSLFA